MKGMKRRMMTTLAALVAVLTLAVVAGWGRSLFRSDVVMAGWHPRPAWAVALGTASSDGSSRWQLVWARQQATQPSSPVSSSTGPAFLRGWHWVSLPAPRRSVVGSLAGQGLMERLGFRWTHETQVRAGWRNSRYGLTIPYWFVLAVAGSVNVACVSWVVGDRRVLRRRSRGQCAMCGYDLRGSGAACPECGTSAGSAAATMPPHERHYFVHR